MYKLLLILRYLRRKLAPLFAALAVTLCTAMVIIVISVMGGFLEMMRTAAKTLTGDVMVRGDLNGFPHYEEMIRRLEARPEIDAAAPVIRSYALANIAGQNYTIELEGIDPQRMDNVTALGSGMHWSSEQFLDTLQTNYIGARGGRIDDVRLQRMRRELTETDLREFGMQMRTPETWGELPAIVPGVAVNQFNERNDVGDYDVAWSLLGSRVTLTVLRLSAAGQPIEPAVEETVVVNEFKSGLYEVDANRIYMGFDHLQRLLRMDAYEQVAIDPETGELLDDFEPRQFPGRATEVSMRKNDAYTLAQAHVAAREVVLEMSTSGEYRDLPFLQVLTWEQRHGTFLNAVQKEKVLLTILFAIISIVAIAMIGVIFYMIVLEKTRDIGILRAVGASRAGIMGVFVGYGLAIGIVGAALGLILAMAIVYNINEIQDWLANHLGTGVFYAGFAATGAVIGAGLGLTLGVVSGRLRDRVAGWLFGGALALGIAGCAVAFVLLQTFSDLGASLNERLGFRMWDPRIYYFDRIPSQVDFVEVSVIFLFAVASSVLGSVVPSILASLVDPVESLRYE